MAKPPNTVPRKSKLEWVSISALRVDPEAQRSLNAGWVKSHVSEFDPDQLGFVLVNKRAGKYYVIDGQHRIALLRAVGWGDQLLQVEVFEDLSLAEEAALFLERNDRLNIRTFDKFRISVTANDPVACDIDRIVRAQGLAINVEKQDGHIAAVRALEFVYRGGGLTSRKETPDVLAKTLATIKDSWGKNASGFEGKIIEGIGLAYLRYDGGIDRKVMAEKLGKASGGPAGIVGRAKALKDMKGRTLSHCVAAVVVDQYNQGRRTKLADWWS